MKFENKGVATGILSTQKDLVEMSVFEIGSWDMDTDGHKAVPHALDNLKIVSVSAIIFHDTASTAYTVPLHINSAVNDAHIFVQPGNIHIYRTAGRIFDDTVFSNAGINRGYVTIWSLK